MKHRTPRRPDWRKSPPRRMIRYADPYMTYEERMLHAWMNHLFENPTPNDIEEIRRITSPFESAYANKATSKISAAAMGGLTEQMQKIATSFTLVPVPADYIVALSDGTTATLSRDDVWMMARELIQIVVSNPSKIKTQPVGDGLFQHTLTWEAA